MVYKKLTKKDVKEMCEWLEFYDKHRYLPFEKKRIDVTISGNLIIKLSKIKNKSRFIEKAITKEI